MLSRSAGNSRRSWRLHSGWVSEPSVEALVSPHIQDYWDNNEGSTDGLTVWDAFKASTRGVYIAAIKAARVEKNSESEMLQAVQSSMLMRPPPPL